MKKYANYLGTEEPSTTETPKNGTDDDAGNGAATAGIGKNLVYTLI